MLKIKDNVDLKELEKFGFEKQPEYAYGYYFKCIFSTGARIAICKNRDEFREKEICLHSLELKLQDSINDYEETLFDLISAGLVEKVSEKNENKINYCCEECIKYFSKEKADENA